MADIIKHKGVVERVEGTHVTVRIVQTSACSACSLKGHCNSSESKEKRVDVYEVASSYQVGEEVVVCATTSMGMQAVFLAFGIPLVILLLALAGTVLIMDGNDLVAALACLLVIVPYYLILYFCKDKLKRTFAFTIEKQ